MSPPHHTPTIFCSQCGTPAQVCPCGETHHLYTVEVCGRCTATGGMPVPIGDAPALGLPGPRRQCLRRVSRRGHAGTAPPPGRRAQPLAHAARDAGPRVGARLVWVGHH
jgi:hypothetical protein